MAFMLPVIIAETCYTTSTETLEALPLSVQRVLRSVWGARIAALLLITWFGVRLGLNTRDPNLAILACVGAVAILTIMSIIWALITRTQRYTFRSLLPKGRETVILFGMLIGYYIYHLIFVR